MKISRTIIFVLATVCLAACSAQQNSATNQPLSDNPTPADAENPALSGTNAISDQAAASPTEKTDSFDTALSGEPMSGCVLQTLIRPPDATETSIFKPVTATDWTTGLEDAPVTIIVYGDFQCPQCAQLATILAQLKADFPENVRLVYRHYPQLDVYDNAGAALAAAESAGVQEKFWEMHDLLYARQADWTSLSLDEFQDWVTARAGELGLNEDQFAASLISQAFNDMAQERYDESLALGIPGTPFLLINGRIYDGPTDYDNLNLVVRLLSLQERQFNTCPPVIIDPAKDYIATIETEKGDIVVQLFAQQAPLTVNNFVFLAMNGWYDGVTFHRVLPGYIAQAGDPSGTGFGGPGYAFVNEDSDLKFDSAGLIAMANSGRDTNGSQFFITFTPAPSLDGGYTIFGRVLEGMNVAQSLQARDPRQGINLPQGDRIITITITES